jgi:hypothetical protein
VASLDLAPVVAVPEEGGLADASGAGLRGVACPEDEHADPQKIATAAATLQICFTINELPTL